MSEEDSTHSTTLAPSLTTRSVRGGFGVRLSLPLVIFKRLKGRAAHSIASDSLFRLLLLFITVVKLGRDHVQNMRNWFCDAQQERSVRAVVR